MVQAIVGLSAVVVGALVTGTGDSWHTRRTQKRVSARLVRRELSDADGALEYATSLQGDKAVADDLRNSIEESMVTDVMWGKHRQTLAATLSERELETVAVAYGNLGHVLDATSKGDEALATASRAAYEQVKQGYRALRDTRLS